jgi:hypothetical protein
MGNGYYQRRIRDAMGYLSPNPSFTDQCNAHREIQRSFRGWMQNIALTLNISLTMLW